MSLQLKVSKGRLGRETGAIIGASGLLVATLSLSLASGASFSDTKTGYIISSTGALSLGLANGVRTLDLPFSQLVPGAAQAQSFTLKNAGSIPGSVHLRVVAVTARDMTNVIPGQLHYVIDGAGVSAPLDGNGATINLGMFQPDDERAYSLSVLLDSNAGNGWQAVTLSNALSVTLTQQ